MVAKPRTIQKMASNISDRHLRRKMSQLISLRELVAQAELSSGASRSRFPEGARRCRAVSLAIWRQATTTFARPGPDEP